MTAPPPLGVRRAELARSLLVAGAVAAVLYHCWWFSDFTVDDGAISFCYARNLAHGHGLVLVPGMERVEGYTNFLWVVLLAAGIRLGIDVVTWSHLAGAVTAAFTVVGTAELVAELRGRRSPLDAIPAFICATLLPISYWAMSGLEGGLYTALIVWCAARLLAEPRDPRSRPLSAALAAAAALTRPDGLAILAVACALRLLSDREPRRLLRWYALALVPVVLHLVWRYAYYAYWVPNTFFAKTGTPFHVIELVDWHAPGWQYVRGFVDHHRLWPLIWVTGLALLPGPRFFTRAGLVGMVLVLVLFPVYSRGDWMSEGRFLVATLPLLVALAAGSIARLTRLLPRPAFAWAATALAFVGLAALVMPTEIRLSITRRHVYPVPMATVAERGHWYRSLADQLELKTPSALDGDLGGSTYYSGMPMVDLGGLADVTLAHWKLAPSVFREYIHHERRPTFIRSSGFWLNDGVQRVPEFQDRYIPGPAAMPGMYIDRAAFLEPELDTRAALARLPNAGLALLRAEVGADVRLWLLATAPSAPATARLVGAHDAVVVAHPLLGRTQWRAGDIVKVTLHRPAGPLQLCDGLAPCVALAEGATGAPKPAWPTPSTALLERMEQRGELELVATLRRRLGLSLTEVAATFSARASAALAAGDTARAFRDFSAALRADPSRAWARRHIEALRFVERQPYRYVYVARLDEALRTLHLHPDPQAMAVVAELARAADEPERAALAYLTFRLVPESEAARVALAECLARAGLVDDAAALVSSPPKRDADRAVAGWIAGLAGHAPAPSPPGGREVARGLTMTATFTELDAAGRVRLSVALRKTAANAPDGLAVAGHVLPFDRRPSTWAAGEVVVHTVTLDLPPGESHVAVGSADVTVAVDPFTHDFETGRLDGWSGGGDAFDAARWPTATLPMLAAEGQWSVSSRARAATAAGQLRSPPLRDDVDAVCFVLAGGYNAGVRLENAAPVAVTGRSDGNQRPACLAVTDRRGPVRVVLFDNGPAVADYVQADDFACFAGGLPVPCAGAARIVVAP